MRGPACIFWANLTPSSLKFMANYLDATVGAVGGSAARPDRILPGVMVDAARIKDGGAGLLLAKYQAGLMTHGVPGVPFAPHFAPRRGPLGSSADRKMP